MQFISALAVIFVFAFSLLQCDKANLTSKENTADNKTNSTAAANNTNSTVAANNTNSPVVTVTPDDGAPRITLEDAKKDFDTGNVVFVDTRAEVQYQQEHIKGAINIPAEAFQTRYAEVPKGKKIIAYCS